MAKPEPELDIRRGLKVLGAQTGRTFEDMAKAVGVHPRTLARWARGNVGIQQLNRLAISNGVDLITIIGWMEGKT